LLDKRKKEKQEKKELQPKPLESTSILSNTHQLVELDSLKSQDLRNQRLRLLLIRDQLNLLM
jgi:hypothetical protein